MSDRREPLDTLLDLTLYAPIGAVLHGPKVVGELAARGRQDVANAKVLGTVALARGEQQLGKLRTEAEGALGDLFTAVARAAGAPMAGADSTSHPDADPAPDPTSAPGAAAGPEPDSWPSTGNLRLVEPTDLEAPDDPDASPDLAAEAAVPAPPVGELPIPDYDNLSASQVVPRLDELGGDELDRVRLYEQTHRGRMTILSRIAQLQAG